MDLLSASNPSCFLQGGSMLSNQTLSRRSFLAATSCFGAAVAFAKLLPLPALGEDLAQDARIAQTPLVDKGFASVRKIGNGVYATISDFSKGAQTICNGGFLIGRDAALLIEGFASPAGAGFQMDTLRDRKSTRLNSSHVRISYAVFCLKKKNLTHHVRSAANHAARLN